MPKKLRNAGVNYTVDIAVIHRPTREVLLIKRRDESWALPGGFVEDHEGYRTAAIRELAEETNVVVTDSGDLRSIYTGHVYDPRQRLDRWIETSLFVYWVKHRPVVEAGSDAQMAMWIGLDHINQDRLYADHSFLLSQVRLLVGRPWRDYEDEDRLVSGVIATKGEEINPGEILGELPQAAAFAPTVQKSVPPTVNQLRVKEGLPPLPGMDIPVDPYILAPVELEADGDITVHETNTDDLPKIKSQELPSFPYGEKQGDRFPADVADTAPMVKVVDSE